MVVSVPSGTFQVIIYYSLPASFVLVSPKLQPLVTEATALATVPQCCSAARLTLFFTKLLDIVMEKFRIKILLDLIENHSIV